MRGPLGGGGLGAGAPPPPPPFPVISGLVGRWNIDSANNQVDGGSVTQIGDLSGSGGPFTGGTGLQFSATRWDTDFAANRSAIQTPLADYMFAASAPLIAAFVGVRHPCTVIDVYQDLNAGGSTLWSAEVTYPYVQSLRKDNATLVGQLQYQNGSPTFSFSTVETQGPVIKTFTRNTASCSLYINGIPDAANPLTVTDPNDYHVTEFSWGEQDGNHSASMLHKERLVYNRELTGPERAQIEQWLAQVYGLSWCQALGAGSGTTGNDVIVIPVLGSSNAAGQGTTLYPRVCNDVWTCDWDFFTRTVPKGQPISTVQPATSVPPITRPLNGNIADAWSALADTLKADPAFANKTLLFVPLAVGLYSSTSCVSGIATTPRDITTGYGNTWYKVKYALRAKNAKLGPVIIYQGEVNATISLAAATTTLSNDWSAFFAAFDADFAGHFLKTKHYFAIVPPVTVPGGIDPTWWAAMRTTWNNLPGTVANLVTVPGTNGPWTNNGVNLHIDTGTAVPPTGLRGDGIAVANAYLSAS